MELFSARSVGLALAALIAAAGLAFVILRDAARFEALEEFFAKERFGRYDVLIEGAARRNGVSPSLVKAVVWRETRFRAGAKGGHGERGLMQITEPAAADWANAEKIQTFRPTDLFDPKVNIDAGTWYLARALRHWAHKDDPVPFALAEYNAGRSRVQRWVGQGADSAKGLERAMDFPLTKDYIAAIVRRYRLYLERGEFGEKPGDPALK